MKGDPNDFITVEDAEAREDAVARWALRWAVVMGAFGFMTGVGGTYWWLTI